MRAYQYLTTSFFVILMTLLIAGSIISDVITGIYGTLIESLAAFYQGAKPFAVVGVFVK